jgi:hypothetical protein
MSWLARQSASRVAAVSAAWVLGLPALALVYVLALVWPDRGALMSIHVRLEEGDAWRIALLVAGPPAALVALWRRARGRAAP